MAESYVVGWLNVLFQSFGNYLARLDRGACVTTEKNPNTSAPPSVRGGINYNN